MQCPAVNLTMPGHARTGEARPKAERDCDSGRPAVCAIGSTRSRAVHGALQLLLLAVLLALPAHGLHTASQEGDVETCDAMLDKGDGEAFLQCLA